MHNTIPIPKRGFLRNGAAIGASSSSPVGPHTIAITGAGSSSSWRGRMPSKVRRLPYDLECGAWIDGVRMPYVSIASDAAAGADEGSPTPKRSSTRH